MKKPMVVPHSGPKKMLAHNATRDWQGATSDSHFKPTKKSGGMGIGAPMGIAKPEMMTSRSHFEPVPHSGKMVQTSPKKDVHKSWKSKGKYSMGMGMKSDD